MKLKCECSDPGCPMHIEPCCPSAARTVLFRSDMDDSSGVAFCHACASDAMDAGVFYENKHKEILAKINWPRKYAVSRR